ncbi:MAG: hypothetical protein CVU41_12100 [Chloroflexi bacterium HGW-Chloroflexi-3]|nr:MAG: hypothetical protein CVU41_12100 [Chloroflexi bacterium HGW-Chloroflexi-3]
MTIEMLLNDPVNSYLIFILGRNSDVVIGVPHHAPLGVQDLPCESHPTSDENTGFIGYHLAQMLDCPCLIAGNYFIDPNKYKSSDYFKKIEEISPKFLIEIHGHAGQSAYFDIEISAGSLDKSTLSEKFADQLSSEFSKHPSLRNYTISGNFVQIHFRATKSLTINTDQWTAFHIELPQKLREDQHQYNQLCESLEKIVRVLLSS